MNNNPENLTTIIIPSKRTDYLLLKCINKIRELYKTVKIILVLDEINGDNSFSDENIMILKSENCNMSAKRNLGIKNSYTKYAAFIDSDAYPKENWLENAVNFLENNTCYTAVTGRQFSPKDDNFVQICLRHVRFNRLFTHKEWCMITDENAKEQDCTGFITSNVIIKKSDYENNEGMNENIYLAEDNEFSARLTKKGCKIRFIPNVSVYHRESTFYPFFRKIYCMSYYYANMFIKGRAVKNFRDSIYQFYPLAGIVLFILLWTMLNFCGINPSFLLILPLIVIVILLTEAFTEAQKLKQKKIRGFFVISAAFFCFCGVWVVGTLLGTVNFPTKKIQNLYKYY